MDRYFGHARNVLNPPGSFPSPFRQDANHTNFEGVHPGFRLPETRYLYSRPSLFGHANLPPINAVLSRSRYRGEREPLAPTCGPNASSQGFYTPPDVNSSRTPTPSPTRRTSHMHGVESTGRSTVPGAEICGCTNNNGFRSSQTPNLNPAFNAYNGAQSYPRVLVDHLLNPPSQVPSPMYIADEGRGARSSEDLSMAQVELSPINMSICSNTNTSSRTIRPTVNVTEERFHLLNTLHQICQSASAGYIRTASLVHRRNRFPRFSSRYYPYPSRKTRHRTSHSAPISRERETERGRKTPTLLDNISKVSTHLWRKARRHPIDPHRSEAAAVRDMRNLYKWVEVIARSMENDGISVDDGVDSGSDSSGSGTVKGGSRCFPGMRVAAAAQRLCRWLGDEEAWVRCDGIFAELRNLAWYESGGDGESESIV